jgi:hypothetical protein
MVNLSRRRFFSFSAAIIPATNLMPGHSLARVLAPTPRELIMQSLAVIKKEMTELGTIPLTNNVYAAAKNNHALHRAVCTICLTGVEKLGTPTRADVSKYMSQDPVDVPLNVLPITAMKTVLGNWKAPVHVIREDVRNPWRQFVEKYADTLPNA